MRWTVGTQVPRVALLAADAHRHSLHTPGEKASNHYERSLLHSGCDRIFHVSAVLHDWREGQQELKLDENYSRNRNRIRGSLSGKWTVSVQCAD
jgi:hypothetical protein